MSQNAPWDEADHHDSTELMRSDGRVDARLLSNGHNTSTGHKQEITNADCADWRNRVLDGETAYAVSDDCGVAKSTVLNHVRGGCGHKCDAPAIRHTTGQTGGEWVPRE